LRETDRRSPGSPAIEIIRCHAEGNNGAIVPMSIATKPLAHDTGELDLLFR
jgi:hypothetical protein